MLVVDDNADLREYITKLLSSSYEVVSVNDGLAALEAIEARVPDLVVSDVMMPRLDGLGLVRKLRANPETASLPVILLSARAGEEAAVEGLDAGSDDYLVKPFAARELLARVRTHVELSRARREWIGELERANRELDAFSAAVSHDLRAPLRTIEGFARILAEDYGPNLDDKGHDHIDRICNGVGRMSRLIDDLLELSRAGRAPLRRGATNLSELAATVIGDLRFAEPTRNVEIAIQADMIAYGDRALLDVVLVNLIGNAWKYTSKTEAANITFARHPTEADTFLVRDNGAGFDMAHAKGLFAPFQRLHGRNEFPGSGVGLATVRRVIERHGGQIWADAAVGRGATFSFTLPGSGECGESGRSADADP